MIRPSWDDTWLGYAELLAKRSLCDGAQIAAVIVDMRNRPIASGYNGPPAGFKIPVNHGRGFAVEQPQPATCTYWCPRRQSGERTQDYGNCVTIHAEANALMFADRRDYAGGTLYVTAAICWDCGKLVANSGLGRVVVVVSAARDLHRKPYPTIDFMRSCGLVVDVKEVA